MTVTEVCPYCESEITMEWDVADRGYKAYCPVCGSRLMLCDECQHGEPGYSCNYDSKTDTCRHNKPEFMANRNVVLQRALDRWGAEAQTGMVFEEMAELQKELCKWLRGLGDREHIAEEIADVEIMLDQMKLLHNCADECKSWRLRKLGRLSARLGT